MTRPNLSSTEPSGGWWQKRIDALGGWGISLVVHGVLLLLLALVILPVVPEEKELILTSLTVENESEVIVEPIEIQPEEIIEGTTGVAAESVAAVNVAETPAPVTIDVDERSLSLPLDLEELLGPEVANRSDFAGRSEAARAALVKAFGGTTASEAAVTSGLRWLAEHQNADGSWNFAHRREACGDSCPGEGRLRNHPVAATSLALLCYLGAGHTHQEGRYQEVVGNGLRYLLDHAEPSQYGVDYRDGKGNPGMYSHGLATIVLCEAYGLSRDGRLKRPAQLAVNFIVNAQHPSTGGWRYDFRPDDGVGDTSVVGWQVMALASARIAGLDVPRKTRKMAGWFLDSVELENGAFYGYVKPQRKVSTTAIGLLCRLYLGWSTERPAVRRGVQFLASRGPDRSNMYYNYYATQVLHHVGGQEWKDWNESMREWLVAAQEKNGHAAGSWATTNENGSARDPHVGAGGRLYVTCLAILTLEVYYRHLPLFQRQSVQAGL
ncbi:MAG: prenyltransferase/squalene oxidase repeat-containing protein [Maioricimonas sp. JB045]